MRKTRRELAREALQLKGSLVAEKTSGAGYKRRLRNAHKTIGALLLALLCESTLLLALLVWGTP